MVNNIRSSSFSNLADASILEGNSNNNHNTTRQRSNRRSSARPSPRIDLSSPNLSNVSRPNGPPRRASNIFPLTGSSSTDWNFHSTTIDPTLSTSPTNVVTFKYESRYKVDEGPGSLEPSWNAFDINDIEKDTVGKSSREGSVVSSAKTPINEDVILDVLPSFQMYNALHRNIPQGNVDPDQRDFPPTYNQVAANGQNVTFNDIAPVSEECIEPLQPSVIQETLNSSESTVNDLESLSTRYTGSDYSSVFTTNNASGDNTNIEDDVDADNEISVDQLYSLPKVTSPVNVTIHVTKHVSLPPNKPEEEFALKEYTSGDTIHGYCIIENKSKKPIRFEMVYVAFEGYISSIEKGKSKRTIKRFLRMVDLSASWSYVNLEMGTGLRYKCRGRDFDNSILGLNHNRILEPGVKYKKFFVFRLPSQLLDTTCKQEHFAHCLLPPSLGIDRYANGGKYKNMKVDDLLGYGHLGSKGCPILTNDLAGNDLSINYVIGARIVGKYPKTQKLNLMAEQEYSIRFIPFGFHTSLIGERDPASQLKDLSYLIEERLNVLKTVFKKLKNNEPIRNTDIHGTDLAGTFDDATEFDSNEILTRKMQQLHMANNLDKKDPNGPPYHSNIPKQENLIEAKLNYKIHDKSNYGLGLFNKILSSPTTNHAKSQGDKTGLIVVETTTPIESLQYVPPSLLKKINAFENKTKNGKENWLRLVNLLDEHEQTPLKHIKLNLTCLKSNNSIDHEPPPIKSVWTELVTVTAKSQNSIPIKLSAMMLLNTLRIDIIGDRFGKYVKQIQKDYVEYKAQEKKLNELYNTNMFTGRDRKLSFTDFIPNELYSNVESLAKLNVQVETIKAVFQDQSVKRRQERPWVKKDDNLYGKELIVDIDYSPNINYTLPPSYESCLCSRFYCIRVHIEFVHAGKTYIDIPAIIKNFVA